MRSTKSGPGMCRRSLAIFGDLNPSRDSAFAPKYVSILLPLVLVAMAISSLFSNPVGEHAAGGGVHQPLQFSVRRLNHLCGQLLRLVRSLKNTLQCECLVRPGDHE